MTSQDFYPPPSPFGKCEKVCYTIYARPHAHGGIRAGTATGTTTTSPTGRKEEQ